MNLVEVWIGEAVEIEEVQIKKIKVSFNTNCYGSKKVETRYFDSIEDWENFKKQKYYLA